MREDAEVDLGGFLRSTGPNRIPCRAAGQKSKSLLLSCDLLSVPVDATRLLKDYGPRAPDVPSIRSVVTPLPRDSMGLIRESRAETAREVRESLLLARPPGPSRAWRFAAHVGMPDCLPGMGHANRRTAT